jgi:hypothetical protein
MNVDVAEVNAPRYVRVLAIIATDPLAFRFTRSEIPARGFVFRVRTQLRCLSEGKWNAPPIAHRQAAAIPQAQATMAQQS